MDKETQNQQQNNTTFLVDAQVMQAVMNCLGEMKLKDTGGLYVKLLQLPQIPTESLQTALDSLKDKKQPTKAKANDQ